MSLLPLLFDQRSSCPYIPHELFSPEEILQPIRILASQLANIDRDTSITLDKDRFQARVDVQQFKPEEISVKLDGDNVLVVEGKHEEKEDQHGFISRHFVRRYTLPEDCDVKKLQSKLSSDGVLSISAPKKSETKQVEYKQIPIVRTGPIRNVGASSSEGEVKKA